MRTTADLKEGIKLMESTDNSMLLDVRSPGEYSEGHLKGSINIPLDTLPKAVMDGLIPKDKTLFVYCRSGARSKRACIFLDKNGYETVNIGGVMGYDGALEK